MTTSLIFFFQGDLSEAVFFSYSRMHEILSEAEIDLGAPGEDDVDGKAYR